MYALKDCKKKFGCGLKGEKKILSACSRKMRIIMIARKEEMHFYDYLQYGEKCQGTQFITSETGM